MPKRVATTRKTTRPSATKFAVNTKRKFGNKTFQVKTRGLPNTLKRTKYWAACSTLKPRLRKARPVLRGGGQLEVVNALKAFADNGDLYKVCKQNNLDSYVDELQVYSKRLLKKINKSGYEEAIDMFLSEYSIMVEQVGLGAFENTPGGQAQKTIKAVIDFYSKDTERKTFVLCFPFGSNKAAIIYYAKDDNMHEAVRATTAWPVVRILHGNQSVPHTSSVNDIEKLFSERFAAILWRPRVHDL